MDLALNQLSLRVDTAIEESAVNLSAMERMGRAAVTDTAASEGSVGTVGTAWLADTSDSSGSSHSGDSSHSTASESLESQSEKSATSEKSETAARERDIEDIFVSFLKTLTMRLTAVREVSSLASQNTLADCSFGRELVATLSYLS